MKGKSKKDLLKGHERQMRKKARYNVHAYDGSDPDSPQTRPGGKA
jgi:hypothetical protein